jgi:hypothetical protein
MSFVFRGAVREPDDMDQVEVEISDTLPFSHQTNGEKRKKRRHFAPGSGNSRWAGFME